MGYYVAVNISFPSNNSEGALKNLQEAARKSLEDTTETYVQFMLEAVIKDPAKHVYGGNKGDLFMWGGVWNYYNFEGQEDDLKRFFLNLYSYSLANDREEPILDFERVMIFVNPEQSERTDVYQLGLKENGDTGYLPEIIVKKDSLELSWGQM